MPAAKSTDTPRGSAEGVGPYPQCFCYCTCPPTQYLSLYLKLDTHMMGAQGVMPVSWMGGPTLFLCCVMWHVCGGLGPVRVTLEMTDYAMGWPSHVVESRPGVEGRFLMVVAKPGNYGFFAKAVDSAGNETSDSLLVTCQEPS
jgi:hypothetical protein